MTIRTIRQKIARSISKSGLPGSHTLANVIRTDEDNLEIEGVALRMYEHFNQRTQSAKRIAFEYPNVAKWIPSEKGDFSKEIFVQTGIHFMTQFGSDDQIAAFFDKYVVDEDSLVAAMTGFKSMYRKWVEWGYIIEFADKPPESNIGEADQPILNDRSLGYIAECLVKANMTLDYDTLKADLLKIFE